MKKIIGIFAILMIALMVAGFAYAHWSKTITITGNVTTGNFHLTPSCDIWIIEPTDKNASSVNCSICGNDVSYTIENAFPSLKVGVMFDLHNDGDVPAGLYLWTVAYDNTVHTIFNASDIAGSVINPGMNETEVETALENWIEGIVGNYVDVTIDFAGSNFWQIDPCDNPSVNITIHFLEGLPQNCSISFTITLEYWNWNEVGYLG